jgi:N-carbamoylputrescine amidase
MPQIMSTVKIGLIQMECEEDVAKNLHRAELFIKEASDKGAQIVCLQELFYSKYFCQIEDHQNFELSEPIPGPIIEKLQNFAKSLNIVLIAPVFEKRTEGIYHNSAVVIDADGSLAGTYRKMHIPDDPCFYEKFYFTPGDLGFKTFSTQYGKIGVLICWDQWFPEAARLCALSGSQILFYPTAIGYQKIDAKFAKKQHSAWETIQRSHAIANGLFVASVNRVGQEDAISFWGQSFVSDPFGEVIAKADSESEQILLVECDLSKNEETRQNWPFFRDRRIDSYSQINKIYNDS